VITLLSDCRVSAALPVSDLARARSFYIDTLGLTPVVEGEDVLAFRCADGTDFGVFISQGRASGSHTQITFFCQNLDAEVADLRARGVKLEEFDMPGATVKDGVYDMNGQRGAWFRDPEGNLLAVAERPDDSLS
jgi:catechol 2,3-dioxygenase-like lactoylglutathione lyase family enzyme